MKEQASPFRAGYDPKAQPGDFYVFAPFYYVAHNTMAFDENDRSLLFDAFEQAGLRPSHFARQTFKKVLGDRGTETDRKCVIGPDKMIADCEWLDGFMLSYQIKNNNQLESIDFAWQDGRLRLQVYGETAIIEGRAIMKTAEPKANVPVFLQIRRQEDELGPASRCPLQELARENAELFLVRANADESFERYTGIWDGDKLCLKGGYQGEGKKLGLQAVDNADWA